MGDVLVWIDHSDLLTDRRDSLNTFRQKYLPLSAYLRQSSHIPVQAGGGLRVVES